MREVQGIAQDIVLKDFKSKFNSYFNAIYYHKGFFSLQYNHHLRHCNLTTIGVWNRRWG